MLTITERQAQLKALGMYDGEVDGIEGAKTKAGYRKLQNMFFSRSRDKDGIYGNDTDKLLQNAYNVKTYTKNFALSEFKCTCGGRFCTGYPAVLDVYLLKNLQDVRDKYGATRITSGMRCAKRNAEVGGAAGSRHQTGKAADIHTAICYSGAGRKQVMAFWQTLPRQRYTYCNINGSNPSMGSSVHVDVE
jgi:hypothetical protein